MPPTKTLTTLAEELARIADIPKCQGCSCYLDVLDQFHDASAEHPSVSVDLAGQLANLIQNFRVTHGCLGCDPCYPVPIANSLAEVGGEAPSCAPTSCAQPPATVESATWPPEPGDYLIGSHSAPVAISTLASKTLPQAIAEELGAGNFALIGITETENIGVEKVVKNIVSNPNIRFLILCGQESRGHLSGQTFAALHKNGLDRKRKVVGSSARTPFLKNLTPATVETFRRQVQLIDMTGCEEIPAVTEAVQRCPAETPGHLQRALTSFSLPRIVAQPPALFIRDRTGFFIILLDRQAGKILLEHYKNDGIRTLVIEGEDAASLYSTAIQRRLLSRLDHAAYLGKELARAQVALRLGLGYEQDRAPGKGGNN